MNVAATLQSLTFRT